MYGYTVMSGCRLHCPSAPNYLSIREVPKVVPTLCSRGRLEATYVLDWPLHKTSECSRRDIPMRTRPRLAVLYTAASTSSSAGLMNAPDDHPR